jgi:hypothetical protein
MYSSKTLSGYIGVIAFVVSCCSQPLLAQTFTSSNLPIVIIDTHNSQILDEPKITADMGIIYNGEGNRNNVTDPFNNFKGKIAIEIRGSSSQMFPKKQYGFEIVDENGAGKDTVLLGLPTEEDWILFAPYNDKSLIRDVLAYKMGNDLHRYTPRTRYCELVIDGDYKGIYVLIEKIKRDKNRVDINKLDPDEASGDDVSGGYIIKIDKMTGDNDPGWMSANPPAGAVSGSKFITFLYEYPDPRDITRPQRDYIQNFIMSFEETLLSKNFKDPVDGYAKYIDVESFVDFFIINEVSKNVDGYRLSTYMHKQRNSDGGKLVMGPIWDFNLAFGNADYCTTGTHDGFVLYFNTICPDDYWLIPFWWKRLLQDPTFARKVTTRWAELRAGAFRTGAVHAYIDSTVAVLNQEASQRNFQRWPVLGQYVWPNYFVGSTYASEVKWLKDWVAARMSWLDTSIEGLTTGTEGRVGEKNMKIAPLPNPFTNSFELKYSIERPGTVQISLYNRVGGNIESIELQHAQTGDYSHQLGSRLPPGLYYCIVNFNGDKESVLKLIKR